MQFTSQKVFALHCKNSGRIESFKAEKQGESMKPNIPDVVTDEIIGTMFIDKVEYRFVAQRVTGTDFVSIKKAGEILGINKIKLYRYIDLGIIPQDCIYKQKGLKAMLDIKKVQKILENLQKNEVINTNGELTDENSI